MLSPKRSIHQIQPPEKLHGLVRERGQRNASGTVTEDVSLDQYRVSVGFGVRLYIAAFGPAPLAFDFAVPLLSEDSDETQVFSFSAEIPF